ncbi:MAG: hypothetical protein PHS84_00960 [Paludibacter sp.]|nr:hypothetical protein [Paludibacter sp.]
MLIIGTDRCLTISGTGISCNIPIRKPFGCMPTKALMPLKANLSGQK